MTSRSALRSPSVWPVTDAGRPEDPPGSHPSGMLGYIRRVSGREQIVICILAIAVAALETVPLELQRRIVNLAIGHRDMVLLAMLGGGFFAVTLLQTALKYLLRVYGGAVSEDVIRSARRRLFAAATVPPGADDASRIGDSELSMSGRAVSVIGPEIDAVGSFVGEGLAEPLVQGGTFVGLLGYMLVVDPLLATVSLLLFAPQAVLVPLVQHRVNRLTGERVRLTRTMGDMVAHATSMTEQDEAMRRSPQFARLEKTFEGVILAIRDTRVRLFRWQYAGKAVVNLFSHLGPLTVLMFGGYLAIAGQTSLGVIVAFVSGFERLAEPARELFGFYQLVSMTRVEYLTISDWIADRLALRTKRGNQPGREGD